MERTFVGPLPLTENHCYKTFQRTENIYFMVTKFKCKIFTFFLRASR